jgi:molybdopterin-dependent oxidoreductase alpha subunit
MVRSVTIKPYEAPAGGWGSAKSLGEILLREGVPFSGSLVMARQNKPGGFSCVSCAWAKPADPHIFEFCENGAKATAWEITAARTSPAFFAAHTVTQLLDWTDHALEQQGRLTNPMRWDPSTDRYCPVAWEDAFAEIGHELKALDPASVVFYASGRASLETSYMWALMARMYGCNNLPDSSNMCHESTSVALPESIGVPVGTVTLEDFGLADCIFFFGQNVGSNAPRMLHPLQEASRRGVPIVTFNPLRERGLERFVNPQSPVEMATSSGTRITSQYHQVKAGGDIAAIVGICKALLDMDATACEAARPPVLDHAFIAEHTSGFNEFAASIRSHDWPQLERRSGLTQGALEAAAAVYAAHDRVIGIYGMGLTQHRAGVEAVQMVANLLLLRGNIGKPGAGICPVRGHSNVQGQRTVGITEKPEMVPLDILARQFDFQPPREKGKNTVEACEGIDSGRVRGFVSLGGNFVRAIPEREAMEQGFVRLRLTVQIATKLNRSHLVHGQVAYILPCLGRIEEDMQATGPQSVTIEDSTGCIRGSLGKRTPAAKTLLSEPQIVAGIARATLPAGAAPDWAAWASDYSLVRDAIAETYPAIFHDFNARAFQRGGFHRPIPARHRQWNTKSGKATFIAPRSLAEDRDMPEDQHDVLRMMTLRSNDQFNTTIYGYDDRFRGIKGTRMVVLMHRNDIDRLGLADGEMVGIRTAADDRLREMTGFRVVPYNIPEGCIGAYYPEVNGLIPLWHYAERSKVPAAKSVPVRLFKPSASG